ncbi:MAG: hypothetical protein ACKO96_21250, partial [Flammeovirgaceae bacterium]
GGFFGDEGSVVNGPAYNQGTVQAIEFSDSVSTENLDLRNFRADPYYTDSIISVGEPMEQEDQLENSDQTEDILAKVMSALADARKEILAEVASQLQALQVKPEEPVADAQEDAELSTLKIAHKELQKDYESALLRIEELQKDLENLKNSSQELDSVEDKSKNKNDDSSQVQLPKPIENPSVAGHGAGTKDATAKLGDFEKSIVNRYLDLKKNQGQGAADLFLSRKKAARHVPRTFNIKDFIQECE